MANFERFSSLNVNFFCCIPTQTSFRIPLIIIYVFSSTASKYPRGYLLAVDEKAYHIPKWKEIHLRFITLGELNLEGNESLMLLLE